MLEHLGPLRALLVVQFPIGLDRTHHMPALTAAEFEQAVGGIPTVEEYINSVRRPLGRLTSLAEVSKPAPRTSSLTCARGRGQV